jgi:anti-sigma B factor antagonist
VEAHHRSGTGAPLAPVVVTLPAEIDIGNADEAGGLLHAALRPGTAVVIADMSATTFADSSAIRALLTARDTAAARNIDLRMVIPAPAVLRILHVLGIASILPIYPSLSAALSLASVMGSGANFVISDAG